MSFEPAVVSFTLPGRQTVPKTALPRSGAADAEAGARHLFVDNIRFWSIFSIIAVHCAFLVTEAGPQTQVLREVLSAAWKFGTVCFFLNSGFLLGAGLERHKPRAYFFRRVRRLFTPWLFWFCVGIFVLTAEDLLHGRARIANGAAALHLLVHEVIYCLFDTAYWFVPNMLIALSVMLLFRRYLENVRFFGVLIGINLFYAVNVYTRWIPSKHTAAILGFVLYLWLGNYAARHQDRLRRWIARYSFRTWALLTVLAGTITFGEGRLLHHLGAPDPLNVMRVSQQVFAVMVALMLFKVQTRAYPRFLDLRRHTFGVYLIHPIFVMVIVDMIRPVFDRFPQGHLMQTHLERIGFWFAGVAVISVVSFGCSRLLAENSHTSWLVGQPAPELEGGRKAASQAARSNGVGDRVTDRVMEGAGGA
jgi:surface polysaccharide O-acyltransferase-like enzyme